MQTVKRWAMIATALGILVILSMLASHLALVDIWHGIEPNLSAEWGTVRFGFLFQLLFIISVFIMIRQIFRLERT